MTSDIELQDLHINYTFKPISELDNSPDIIVYALTNTDVKDITPSSWGDEFESVLETYGTAVIIVTNVGSAEGITKLLDSYTRWCRLNIPEKVQLI